MQRLFLEGPLTSRLTLTDPQILHQISRVLRARVGDECILFCGDGDESRYQIVDITSRSIELEHRETTTPMTELPTEITLIQALPNKHEKIEYILEKGVEIGIRRFIFFRSQYSQRLEISPQKQSRFTHIAREALEQCGGVRMPEIVWSDIDSISTYFRGEIVVMDTVGAGEMNENPWNPISPQVTICVGPEGGWSREDRELLARYDSRKLMIGNRILRTETAGIIGASVFVQKMFS